MPSISRTKSAASCCRAGRGVPGPSGAVGGGGAPGFELRGVDLPTDPFFARGFLFSFNVVQSLALSVQTLVETHPLERPLVQLFVQHRHQRLDLGEPLRQPLHLRRGLRGVTVRVVSGAFGLTLCGACVQGAFPGLLGARDTGPVCGLHRGQARRGLRRRRRGAGPRGLCLPHVVVECLELRATLQRTAGSRVREVDRPVRPA